MNHKFFHVAPRDLDSIEAKDCYSLGEIYCARQMIDLAVTQNKSPDSIALGIGLRENDLYGIGGSYRQWAGSSQLWAVFSPRVDLHPIALRRACLQFIHYAVDKQQLHRVSLTVKSGYAKGTRFAQSLGFELEGKMKKFLPDGEDANLYARFF